MRTVFVSNSWRSIRSAPTSTKAILTAVGIAVLFLIRFWASYKEPRILLDYTGAWQSDGSFVRYLKKVLLQPPSGGEYNLDEPDKTDFSENGQGKAIGQIFQNKVGRSFIEIDAGDGEKNSISLYLERELGWSGILAVESIEHFQELLKKNRQSYAIHARVSDTEMVSVLYDRHEPVLSNLDPLEAYWEIPLFSLMATMKSPELDVLILSADGIELEILETIPWEMVTINVICVTVQPDDVKSLTTLLTTQGYSLIMEHINTFYFVSNEFQKAEDQNHSANR